MDSFERIYLDHDFINGVKKEVIIETIENKIYFIRGQKVMLDFDLAVLYEVDTRSLNQAVKRNIERFPDDFMFKLDKNELSNLISQIVISSSGGRRSAFAFTEQGVAMLSSVLKSSRAIQVNIQIMRTFTRLRLFLATNSELKEKIEELESKCDQQFKVVFDAIRFLIAEESEEKPEIGFSDKGKT